MKYLLSTILSTILWVSTFATAQYPDKIFFNGKTYSLHTNPLEIYFEKYPDKKPKGGLMSSALWRGYVATFEIRDSQLIVKDIEIQIWDTTSGKNNDIKWKSVLNEVFHEKKDMKVDWLTGLLVLPYGKIVNYVHMGYGSTYENYYLLEIDKGDFVKTKQFGYKDYEKFKDNQFKAFKQTDEYKNIKAKLQKDGSTEDFIDKFLRSFVTQYTSKILTD